MNNDNNIWLTGLDKGNLTNLPNHSEDELPTINGCWEGKVCLYPRPSLLIEHQIQSGQKQKHVQEQQ